MEMEQVISYIQFYLGAILSVNIILASAVALLIFHGPCKTGLSKCKDRSAYILSMIALILVVSAFIKIFSSYRATLDFLLTHKKIIAPDITSALSSLDCAYYLDISTILITCIAITIIAWGRKDG